MVCIFIFHVLRDSASREFSPLNVFIPSSGSINKGKAYGRQGKAPTGLILLKYDYFYWMVLLCKG